jgi:hypothetical protein
MAFELPTDEVKGYISELMGQIGEAVTIDGVDSLVMIADLERIYNNMQQSMKRTVFIYESVVSRGSRVVFTNSGDVAIVYSTPNDDIVNKSANILMCNCSLDILSNQEVYDTDPTSSTFGDIITSGEVSKGVIDGFIERLSAREKQYDVGLFHDAILRFVTFTDSDIELGDVTNFKGKKYRVIDVDDITDGIRTVQLENLRD